MKSIKYNIPIYGLSKIYKKLTIPKTYTITNWQNLVLMIWSFIRKFSYFVDVIKGISL